MNGITGDPQTLTTWRSIISNALSNKIKILVMDIEDIKSVKNTDELVNLVKRKITQLHVSRTTI